MGWLKIDLVKVLLGSLVIFFAGNAISENQSTKNNEPIELVWVIAHEPVAVFERSAKAFKSEVESKSQGQIKVKVVTYKEHKSIDRIEPEIALEDVRKGKVQMSQVYTDTLVKYSPQFKIIELPYLFRGHDHVDKVVEGPVGQNMLASLEKSNLTGVGFTYSGGYKVIVSKTDTINEVSDFKQMYIRPWPGTISPKYFKSLGAKIHHRSERLGLEKSMEKWKINSGETTFATMPWASRRTDLVKSVIETNHSIFMTALVMNKEFLSSLSPRLQNVVKGAALNAARLERRVSVADGLREKSNLIKKNIKVVSLSPDEEIKMKTLAKELYAEFSKEDQAIIRKIQNTK